MKYQVSDWFAPSGLTYPIFSGTSNGELFSPLCMRIAAQTIGMDLVAVKPLSMPMANLGMMDFKYEESASARAQRKREERAQKIKRIFNDRTT